MKMVSCNIIKDILPLYLDGVVSDDTKKMVEEHLKECDQCRNEAMTLKQDVVLPVSKSVRLAETEVVKGLKRKLFRKKFFVSAISVILTIGVLSGIYSYMALTKTCVPYDSGKIRVEDENGALYVVYQGDDLEGTVSFDPAEVTIDGKEQNVFTFYCYTEKTQERIMYVGQKDEIDRIYYGEFDSTDPLSAEYDYASMLAGPEMEIIWER